MINYKFEWLDANSRLTLGNARLTSKIEGSDLKIMMDCKSYGDEINSTCHFIMDYNKDGEYSNFYSGDIGRQNIKVLQSLGELPKKVTDSKDYEYAMLKCRQQFVDQSFPVWATKLPLKWIITICCRVLFVTFDGKTKTEMGEPVSTKRTHFLHQQFVTDKLDSDGIFDALSR